MSKKILIATEKPFAPAAVENIKKIADEACYKLSLLERYQNVEELVTAIADANALIVRSDKITSEIIEKAHNLEVIVRAGAGYDNIDLEAASRKNIAVMNTPGQNSNAVAELAMGMMIYLSRNGFSGKSGKELRGKSLGIHAFGNVGKYVVQIGKGLGMEIFAYDPYVPQEDILRAGVKPVQDADELYSKCDYISLHLPKVKETIGSVNFDLMSKMKKGAMLVNTARAEVIDDTSLKQIMETRPDLLFASDVAPSDREELESKYKDRVFITPKKMGAQTAEANIKAGIAAANQIVAFFQKDDRTFQVNK